MEKMASDDQFRAYIERLKTNREEAKKVFVPEGLSEMSDSQFDTMLKTMTP